MYKMNVQLQEEAVSLNKQRTDGSYLFYSSHELFAVTVIFSWFHHQFTESLNSEGRTEQAKDKRL